MKNNRTANQNKAARAAYRALVAARTAGKALADIGSSEAARTTIRQMREEARLNLRLAGHYHDEFTADEAITWCAEDKNGEPWILDEDDKQAREELTFNLHNNIGDYIRIDYTAVYYKGQEQEARLQFKGSHLATDEDDKKRRLYNIAAYKSARFYASRLANKVLQERAREEYGRESITDKYNEWELYKYVYEEDGGYKVVFEYSESGEELLTVYFAENGRMTYAEDGDGDQVTPTEDETDTAHEAVVEYLTEKLNSFRGRY